MKNIDKLNILLVDDDEITLKSNVGILTVLGVKNIFTAKTVADAKKIISTYPLDGALLDLVLPDGNGLNLGEYCASNNIPVVFQTGTDDDFNNLLMLNIGWVLHKPHSIAGLRRAIETFSSIHKDTEQHLTTDNVPYITPI